MKRLFIATIFAAMILGLMLSCASNKLNKKGQTATTQSGIEKDTSGLNSPIKIDPFYLNILPPSSGVQFYRNGIIFLSTSKNEGKMLPGHLSFGTLQAYYSLVDDSIPGPYQVFSPNITFPYPCEALTFSRDFGTMYFTRISETDKREKIFHAEFLSGGNGWSLDPGPLDFCTDGSSYSHPSITDDGNMMIFASDNPGSLGGMDLFITRKLNGKWTEPKSLGDAINTKGNELFPFLDDEKNLFFSSDGLPGNGGYDVFISKFNGDGWDKAFKLTNLINSKNNEIAFSIRKDGKLAFFTSKPNSRNGEMQLYKVSLNERISSNNLSGILYSMAISEKGKFEIKTAEINLQAEKMKADSIEAARSKEQRIEAERLKNAKLKADSIEAARTKEQRFEAEKIRNAKLKADSIAAVNKMEAARLEAYNKEKKDVIIYKVQFYSSPRSRGTSDILINGKTYKSFEYFYLGEYRSTIGEFSTLTEAKELQNSCRKSGYSQAFVVAFKNSIRTNDPNLFK
jgi:hypothetical protein